MGFSMAGDGLKRDQAGINKLIEELTSDLEVIRKSIKNDSYTTLINVINDNWSGEDKDYFLKELNTELNGLDQYLKKTENKVSMDFNNAYYEFLTFQNHNKI